ncbi:hypothetical protein [Winogradskyella jejuensis]|uniref:Uncharacterized protein n=1 Tax=Winogradskyella jejuensis TaxID=1089305 RepID=A0A1M5T2P3_9FLAO|nr:hypothetical protein [Winogradskyella jejuensis]SHH44942.1 hypothetical protein SAMN05444148_2042 [Winogradskyella jejuensis]
MDKKFISAFVIIITISFYANGQWRNRYPKNAFKSVQILDYNPVINNDSIVINELRFSGVRDRHYIQKGMYDNFGKWSQKILSTHSDTLLIWNNIKLLKNQDKLFSVAAKGRRIQSNVYTAVFIFDKNDVDQLNLNSPYRKELIDYFKNLIKNSNDENVDFYLEFWKTFAEENNNSRSVKYMLKKYESIKKKNTRKALRNNRN